MPSVYLSGSFSPGLSRVSQRLDLVAVIALGVRQRGRQGPPPTLRSARLVSAALGWSRLGFPAALAGLAFPI
jgi:hypothetical protein